jgi:hypothetical protein
VSRAGEEHQTPQTDRFFWLLALDSLLSTFPITTAVSADAILLPPVKKLSVIPADAEFVME